MPAETLLQKTRSVCPHCLQNLAAEIIGQGDKVFLRRKCPEHGVTEELIWRGEPDFSIWKRPKTYNSQFLHHREPLHGCPFDCGLCTQHLQKSCAVLYELTDACNLRCPVCFASSGNDSIGEKSSSGRETSIEKKTRACVMLDEQIAQGKHGKEAGNTEYSESGESVEGGIKNNADTAFAEHLRALHWIHSQAGQAILQLSGGEPTLSPWLVPLVREASALFPAVQLNTNGIRLAEDETLAFELAQAGLGWVFLQFDGTDDRIYEKLRGKTLFRIKERAIEKCREAGLAVVLVPTIAKGVNEHAMGEIVQFGVSHAPTVRGVHFQPMTRSGRNFLQNAETLTLPEVLQGLETQTNGLVKKTHASPPGCEHERCSFHCRYTLQNGTLIHTPSSCCCGNDYATGETEAEFGAVSIGLPSPIAQISSVFPDSPDFFDSPDASRPSGSDGGIALSEKADYLKGAPESSDQGADRAIASVVHNWQKAEGSGENVDSAVNSFDAFIARHRATVFSITCMAFQDVWNLDLQRLQGCCIHIYAAPNRLVPFCAYNLTDSNGIPLYRQTKQGG